MKRALDRHSLILILALSLVALNLTGCSDDETEENSSRTKPRRSSPANRPTPSDRLEFAEIQRTIHEMVNQHRQSLGLRPLTLVPLISEQAEAHSRDMASGRAAFGHDGFKTRTERIAQRLSHKGSAENVASNRGFANPAREAVIGWLNSPGHRKNIEGQYELTGIGIAKNEGGEYYFTQIFLHR
jgi:uncharacterized protein YkwD